MKQIELTETHKSKLLEMCKIMFPEYDDILFHTLENDSLIGYKYMKSMNFQFKIHWFEFCMTHLAEKIIATYVINKDGDKIYKRTLNDDLSKFYLESLNFTRGFNKNHPIDYLYSEFKKLN